MEDPINPKKKPSKTRWHPTQDQIDTLESIFSDGTQNPTTIETENIRESLERFGSVTATSIFHWFQNRRQRHRREERIAEENRRKKKPRTEGQPSAFPAVDGRCSINNSAYRNKFNDLLSCFDQCQTSDQTPDPCPEMITVYINGDASLVNRNCVRMTSNLMLYDMDGTLLTVKEGLLVPKLNHGQSYHLEWKQTYCVKRIEGPYYGES